MESSLVTLLDYLKTGAVFMIVITILVAVHELGHFWFARLFGMKVDAFAVMMGGIRSTNLDDRLERPMAPKVLVLALAAVGAVLTAAGGLNGLLVPYTIGLLILAIVLPVWITLRLQALYHIEAFVGIRGLLTAWAIGGAFTAFSTRLQGLTLHTVLGVLFYASLISLLILYYQPVMNKADDAPHGAGQLDIDGEQVPVSFRPLLSRKDRHGTEFSLLLLPLGGFASIKGMHPKPDGSETKIESGFYSKSPFARLMVLFAGPLFSIVFGIILLSGVIVASGKVTERAVLGDLIPGKPAALAGLRKGDEIKSIDNKPVSKWSDMMLVVQKSAGKELLFSIQRKGSPQQIRVTPASSADLIPLMKPDGTFSSDKAHVGQIGAYPGMVRVGVGEAVQSAAMAPVAIVAGLGSIVRAPSTAKDQIGGPAAVAQGVHEASQNGFASVLRLAGLLSISLGVMNLLPVPPLDGGQMVVATAELLRRGKRLSMRVQQTVSTVGFFFVLGLMTLVILLDLGRTLGPK